MIKHIWADLKAMQRATQALAPEQALKLVLSADSLHVLAMNRVRESARRWHVPGVNRALRLVQTALFGIEIGKDVELGEGVYFVHTLGIIIGGDAKIGDRVRFMGNNTVGTAKDNGYPVIEDDVTVGAGARILGPIRVGRGAVIGANAVVLTDVAPGAVVVGVPAKPVERNEKKKPPARRAKKKVSEA